MVKTKETGATLGVVGAAAMWGTMGVFSRHLTGMGCTTLQASAIRIVAAAVLYLLYLLIYDRSLLRIQWQDLLWFLGIGIGSILMMTVCYFASISYSSMSAAAILLYTAPFIVIVLAAICYREPITRTKLGCLAAAFAGCVLISGFGGEVSLKGILYGVGSGIAYAMYSMIGRKLLQKYSAITVSCYAFVFAGIAILPFCNLPSLAETVKAHMGMEFLLWSLGIGAVTAFVPYLLYTYGLAHMETGKATVLAFVEPMVATILGMVCYHERPTAQALFGIGLIFAAVIRLGRTHNEKSKKDAEIM